MEIGGLCIRVTVLFVCVLLDWYCGHSLQIEQTDGIVSAGQDLQEPFIAYSKQDVRKAPIADSRLDVQELLNVGYDDYPKKAGDLPVCRMTLKNSTWNYVLHLLEIYEPNLVRLTIKFVYPKTSTVHISTMPDVIQPYYWAWTYYIPRGYFPYLKWPTNFGLLSFGLLDARSLPENHEPYMVLEVRDTNCSIRLWDNDTSYAVGYALATLVKPTSPFVNYFCFLKLRPHVNSTLEYRLGVHFGYPVEYVRYNCCRTQDMRIKSKPVQCIDQIPKMWQVIKLPFIIGLFVLAYYPLILFDICGKLVAISINYRDRFSKSLSMYTGGYESIESDIENSDNIIYSEVVYLNGKPPIQISNILCGLCGLHERYPNAASRLRRLVFILFAPSIVFIQISLHYFNNNEFTMACLNHGRPMGYLSVLAGYERSKKLFAPNLGGPYVLLAVFYFAGLLYIVLPRRTDIIVHVGTLRHSRFGEISPLFLNLETISCLSPFNFHDAVGYNRVSVLSRSMFYMLLNPKFWSFVISLQYQRIRRRKLPYSIVKVMCILFLPLYIVICLIELLLCVVYYGTPLINTITMVITGYVVHIQKIVRSWIGQTRNLFVLRCLRAVMAIFVTGGFVYFLYSFCTIFLSGFDFLASVTVFCFIAVLVYPNESFGYLFFSSVFIYYCLKVWEKFGDVYHELLIDTVEICNQLEMNYGEPFTGINEIQTPIRQPSRLNPKTAIRILIRKNHVNGIPRDLFQILIKQYRPIYKHVAQSGLKIILILSLLAVSVSIVVTKHDKPIQGLSEMMHVVFIVAIGAIPRLIEVAMDTMNMSVKKDIEMGKIKETVIKYWEHKSNRITVPITEVPYSIRGY